MKSLFRLYASGFTVIFGVLLLAMPAAAQYSMRTGALGGNMASRTMGRPLGGFAPGLTGYGSGRGYRGGSRTPYYGGYPYAYSVWVPDYFDYLNAQSPYASPYGAPPEASVYYAPPPVEAPAPQQPVIINQYFGAPAPPQAAAPEASNGDGNSNSNAQAPGDPIGSPRNYYLIAYKNHSIYSALAYWVEDKTLHYVTTQNTHNQASLDLIDLKLTKSLNQRNDVPFSIPGQ